jgi:hypothetical protein
MEFIVYRTGPGEANTQTTTAARRNCELYILLQQSLVEILQRIVPLLLHAVEVLDYTLVVASGRSIWSSNM